MNIHLNIFEAVTEAISTSFKELIKTIFENVTKKVVPSWLSILE